MYAIQTTINHERHGCTSAQQLPTFYLNSDTDEDVERMALDILSGWNDNEDTTIYLKVTKI